MYCPDHNQLCCSRCVELNHSTLTLGRRMGWVWERVSPFRWWGSGIPRKFFQILASNGAFWCVAMPDTRPYTIYCRHFLNDNIFDRQTDRHTMEK
ncbi:hypothetical protein DPMN_048836 [Dreissena polymorpha]|uniref:Uncharacterized protein n=1 Tax=Dreissena polymorpha TaxID=45954 RepID=A0A9D4I398_DREPO|nr:hypothetical protein DPMN_048836 [Dreissena polymorpha]